MGHKPLSETILNWTIRNKLHWNLWKKKSQKYASASAKCQPFCLSLNISVAYYKLL